VGTGGLGDRVDEQGLNASGRPRERPSTLNKFELLFCIQFGLYLFGLLFGLPIGYYDYYGYYGYCAGLMCDALHRVCSKALIVFCLMVGDQKLSCFA